MRKASDMWQERSLRRPLSAYLPRLDNRGLDPLTGFEIRELFVQERERRDNERG